MRIIIFILTVGVFIYSTFMFVTVFGFSGLGGCHSYDPCATEIRVYVWSSLIMSLLSLVGLIGMRNSLSNYSDQKFSIFVIIGFLVPVIMYIFVGDYNKTKNKENSYENVMQEFYQEHCLVMPDNNGSHYYSCDDGRNFPM